MNTASHASVFRWDKDYLVSLLSSGKKPILSDPLVIKAFQAIDRKDFVPAQYKTHAYDDVELDIGHGEELTKPTVVAQMISLLQPKQGGKFLDLGSGTGYSAAILGYVAGQLGKVISIERNQWIWEMARTNIKKYPSVKNIDFIYRDGLEGFVGQAPYDGIHIAFALNDVPEKLKLQLRMEGGRLVCPTTSGNLKVIHRKSMADFVEEEIPGFILDQAKVGMV